MTASPKQVEKQYLGATGPVKAAHAFDVKRLEDYLAGVVAGFAGPLEVKQFEGGQSNPTYLLTTPTAKYVLRRKPPGVLLPSAHAVDREFRVMSALFGAGFPVPNARHLCADESVVGTMFFVMDFLDGRVFWDPLMPDLSPADRRATYEAAADTLADLHTLNVEGLGLSDYGKPGNYFARQIGRWSKQYEQSAVAPMPEMVKLIAWLPSAIPDDDETTLIHGDYGSHNLLLHPSQPKILGVLDWELSTLGHPISDLVYCLIPWYRPDVNDGRSSFRGLDLKAVGLPSMSEFVARYCERAERPAIENIDFYCAFNLFRSAAIGEGIVARARQGNAAASDAASFEEGVKLYAKGAWECAQRAGATG